MTKTLILHDVKAADLNQVLAVMKADGYNATSQLEPDGNYTVIGTKDVPDTTVSAQGN